MIRNAQHISTRVHFKSWSNKAYAIFASLKVEVMISELSGAVASAFGCKKESNDQENMFNSILFSNDFEEEDIDEHLEIACIAEMDSNPVSRNIYSPYNINEPMHLCA